MRKNFKSISMMLFLGCLATGAANASPSIMKADEADAMQ